MKTSIKIKKFWFADVAEDGGIGANWQEIQVGQREATVQFNGSDADVNNYKNVLGAVLESALSKGDKTMNFQLADLTPAVVAEFVGGTVSASEDADSYDAPENENQSIEKSLMFLTEKNILFRIARASIDAYPIVNDDDLHYHQINSVVLQPEKSGTSSYGFDVLKNPDKNDIVSFTFGAVIDSAPAAIDTIDHTVAITVAALTDITDLTPVIGVSLGASIVPGSGIPQDFSTPFEYEVESANGEKQTWTITVTVTP